MKGKNLLGTQWSLEPSCPINLGIQPSSCPRILQTCTRTEKFAAGSKKPISKIYMCQKNPENISITQSCARKRSITCCIVQFGGSKDGAFLPSLHQTSNFHEGAQGAEKESHQILLGTGSIRKGALGRQAPTPVDWAKWWEMDEINGQVCYIVVESN